MNTKDLKKTKWQYTSTFGTCYCIILLKIVFIWFYYKLMKVCYIILYTVWYQIIKLIYYLYICSIRFFSISTRQLFIIYNVQLQL